MELKISSTIWMQCDGPTWISNNSQGFFKRNSLLVSLYSVSVLVPVPSVFQMMIYLQWLSMFAKLKGKISVIERSITAMDSTMMVGTGQDHVLYIILSSSA